MFICVYIHVYIELTCIFSFCFKGGEGVDLEIGQGHGVEIETDEEIGQGHETEMTDADEDQGAAVARRTRKNGGEKIERNCQWTRTLEG